MLEAFARHLYLRIWLAVVGSVAVLTLVVAWAWQVAQERSTQNSVQETLAREISITSEAGDQNTLLQGTFERIRSQRRGEGGGLEFVITAEDGQRYHMEMSNQRGSGGGGGGGRAHPPPSAQPVPFWLRPPFGFLWLLGLVGLAVALGVFPIIRRLLKRLENLQRSVQRFGQGDLSIRVPSNGQDEVADLARQFNAAAQKIEALVRSHQNLLANASHELRSPLARLRMGLELLDEPEKAQSARQEIQRNIAELDQLVEEILLASRLEHPAQTQAQTPEIVDLLGLAVEECSRVDAELVLPDGICTTVEIPGTAKLLRRAVRNLLENARRYGAGKIELELELCSDKNCVLVRVQDEGQGVPTHLREQIFEKFYRVAGTVPNSNENTGGAGLGLALVRSIAQFHSGQVVCIARPDGQSGACFELRLPVFTDSVSAS